MPETKGRIIQKSKELFEEYGIANVRLQQIADAVGISTGNLSYHFRNKEMIVESVYCEVERELINILALFRTYPNLLDLDHQLNSFYEFTREYPYYFSDIIELRRNYGNSGLGESSMLNRITLQFKNRIDFNVERGILRATKANTSYQELALAITNILFFQQLTHRLISQEWLELTEYKKSVWNLMLPHFTDEGLDEYQYVIAPLLIGS